MSSENKQKQEGMVSFTPDTLVQPQQESPYGKEWRRAATLVHHLGENLAATEAISAPEDAAIAKSVHYLLSTLVREDRTAYLHVELDSLIKQAQKEGWSEDQVYSHVKMMGTAYLATNEDVIGAFQQKLLVQGGIASRRIKAPQLGTDFWDKSQTSARLYGFTHLEIKEQEDETVKIQMNPVRAAGIDHIAFPLNSLQIQASETVPIKTNFESEILLGRGSGLGEEVRQHPDVINVLKTRFSELVRMYADNRDSFIKQRDGEEEDTTEMSQYLCDYLSNNYLKTHLDEQTYNSFETGLGYLESSEVDAVLSIIAFNVHVLNPRADMRKQNSWYMQKYPQDVALVVQNGTKKLSEVGVIVSDDGITNMEETIQKMRQNPEYGEQLNKIWEEVFSGGRQVTMDMIRDDEVNHWASHYKEDIYKSILQRALEISRGVITSEQYDQSPAAFFFK